MNLLMDEFKKLYEQKGLTDSENGFIIDGIIDEAKYKFQKNKVLFIAKEHNHINDNYKEGSYIEWWKTGVRYNFSHRLSEWAYGILDNFPPYSDITDENKLNAQQSIAFINLKKTYGGASANPVVLATYVEKSRHLLLQQIKEISPTIILCCLRYDYLPKKLFGFTEMIDTGHGFSYSVWDKKLVINFYHPSSRKNKVDVYQQLEKVVNFSLSDSSTNPAFL